MKTTKYCLIVELLWRCVCRKIISMVNTFSSWKPLLLTKYPVKIGVAILFFHSKSLYDDIVFQIISRKWGYSVQKILSSTYFQSNIFKLWSHFKKMNIVTEGDTNLLQYFLSNKWDGHQSNNIQHLSLFSRTV